LQRLDIKPLATEAVGALAGAVLGQAPAPALVAWLDERSRGNPLFALGLLKALQDEGADLATPRLRRLPEALAERVIARLGALDEPARSTLEVLAVVGRRVELGSVVALTGRPLDRVGPLLHGLVRSRLVTEEERGREVIYEIAHPLIQETIYEELGAARRRALHRLVARSLLASGPLGEAAPHFARSAEVGDPEAIEALREAVRQAEERELYREALTILGALVDLLPPGDQRWLEVLDALGFRAEWVVDHRADVHAALAIPALRAMDSLLERFPDPARRAAVKFRLTSFLSWGTGQLEEAERAAREARDLFQQAGDTQGALLAELELAFLRGFKGDLSGWFTGAVEVAEAAEAAGHGLVVMHAVGRSGYGALVCGRFEDAEAAFRRGIDIARDHGKTYFQTNSLTGLATSLAFEGRVEEALPILDEAKALNPNWRESLLGEYEIMIRWLAGAISTALAGAQQSVTWNAAGISRRRAIGMAFAALAAVDAGQPADARRYLDLALAVYEGRSWLIWTDCCSHAEAMVAWLGGDPPLTRATLRRTAETMLGKGTCPWAALPLVDLAEVATQTGDPEDAAWAAAQLEQLAEQVDRDLYRALANLGRAWSDLASGGATAAAGAAERAVGILSVMGYRGFLGRALDILGRSLVAVDRARARESLQRAASTFDAGGATWRRDGVLEALRRLGEAGKRAAAALGPSALTPREREVAILAARGRTAPQIALQLYIGERTVESHLARIYAKLGVASKYELVQRAGELGLAGPTEPAG
jgi:DNA-binding CsgD family transcriptional regulator